MPPFAAEKLIDDYGYVKIDILMPGWSDRCVGCGRFLGGSNRYDSVHCVDCWSYEDEFWF